MHMKAYDLFWDQGKNIEESIVSREWSYCINLQLCLVNNVKLMDSRSQKPKSPCCLFGLKQFVAPQPMSFPHCFLLSPPKITN